MIPHETNDDEPDCLMGRIPCGVNSVSILRGGGGGDIALKLSMAGGRGA